MNDGRLMSHRLFDYYKEISDKNFSPNHHNPLNKIKAMDYQADNEQ